MTEACILFAHHANDHVTRFHLKLLQRINPFPVLPLRNQSDEGVESSIRPVYHEAPWHGTDGLLYAWFRDRTFDAERYIFLEWDCRMTMPVREYYAEVWNSQAAASEFLTPDHNPHWCWFRELNLLPAELRDSAAGVAPLNGLMLSHEALRLIASKPIPADVFSELRLGTLLRANGIHVTPIPAAKASTNSFKPYLTYFDPTRPGLYHPIKSLDSTAFSAEEIMPDPRILNGMTLLGKLAMQSSPAGDVFLQDAAWVALGDVGWTDDEIRNVVHYLRDNGILSETSIDGEHSAFRFKVPRIAEQLASLAPVPITTHH